MNNQETKQLSKKALYGASAAAVTTSMLIIKGIAIAINKAVAMMLQ